MKKFLIFTFILAILVVAIPTQAQIPADKQYIVQQAAFSIALAVMDEADSTPNHYERLMLARRVLSSPGSSGQVIAQIAEAKLWIVIEWETVSPNVIRTNMEGVWDALALATYGPAPTRPE